MSLGQECDLWISGICQNGSWAYNTKIRVGEAATVPQVLEISGLRSDIIVTKHRRGDRGDKTIRPAGEVADIGVNGQRQQNSFEILAADGGNAYGNDLCEPGDRLRWG